MSSSACGQAEVVQRRGDAGHEPQQLERQQAVPLRPIHREGDAAHSAVQEVHKVADVPLDEAEGDGQGHSDVLPPLPGVRWQVGVHADERVADAAVIVALQLIGVQVVRYLVLVTPDQVTAADDVHEQTHALVEQGRGRGRAVVAGVHEEAHACSQHTQQEGREEAALEAAEVGGHRVQSEGGEGLTHRQPLVRVVRQIPQAQLIGHARLDGVEEGRTGGRRVSLQLPHVGALVAQRRDDARHRLSAVVALQQRRSLTAGSQTGSRHPPDDARGRGSGRTPGH